MDRIAIDPAVDALFKKPEHKSAILDRLKRLSVRDLYIEIYRIERGDNPWKIARQRGLKFSTIVGANPGLPFYIPTRKVILIPNEDGVLHEIKKGETINTLADLYLGDITPEEADAFKKDITRYNDRSITGFQPGDIIFIPNVQPKRITGQWAKYFSMRGLFTNPCPALGIPTSNFGWRIHPISGRRRFHSGQDFFGRRGTPVYAARHGIVSSTGWAGGYGNCVVISHRINDTPYSTLYAHMSAILVTTGQKVRRGQTVGRIGSTGVSTGPHLHFEIRENGRCRNPYEYL